MYSEMNLQEVCTRLTSKGHIMLSPCVPRYVRGSHEDFEQLPVYFIKNLYFATKFKKKKTTANK